MAASGMLIGNRHPHHYKFWINTGIVEAPF
jgi:hypothetical protein